MSELEIANRGNPVKYVEIDADSGAISWDAYFEYLRSVREQFTSELYAYASDWGRYSLDGVDSLHDAWVTGIEFGSRENELTVTLLSARQDRRHLLRYVGVKAYDLELSVEFRAGDRDLLAHEFRIENGLVVHETLFANQSRILIVAQNVLPSTAILN